MEAKWTKKAVDLLLGKKIVAVRYMDDAEAERMGWTNRPVVIQLEGELLIFASSDDEGNDGGALFTSDDKTPILPVLR